MRTKIINGIEHTHSSDYLDSPGSTKIEHLLVDIQDSKIITHEKINFKEKEKRNREARKVGEIYLQWAPALFA